jgi:hypothetical protein
MKSMICDHVVGRARQVIVVAVGTTAICCLKTLRTFEVIFGCAPEDRVKVAGFDAKGVTHEHPVSTVDKALQDIALEPGEVFAAAIGDLESRRQAERSGKIWMSPPGYYKDPGIAGTDCGNGAITRNGRISFALNQELLGDQLVGCLRRCQDYQQQTPVLGRTGGEQSVIQIYVMASFTGGTGSGTLIPAIAMIAAKAAALKIHVRITPLAILVGTLNPGDRRTAARNHQLALRSLQAHFEGRLRPLTAGNDDFQMVCDAPLLVSNANAFGEIADLNRVIAVVGQWLYLQTHTTIGPIAYQEGINLQDQAVKDSSGDLRRASTFGLSVINLNKEKVRARVIAKRLGMFYSHLLRKSGSAAATQNATVTFASVGLKETRTDDTAAQRLYSLRSQGNMNVQERGLAVFHQRMGSRTGFQGCTDLFRAGQFAHDQELPHSLIPKMDQEASAVAREGEGVIVAEVGRYLQKQTGLEEGPQFLDTMQDLLDIAEKANQDKLAQAQRFNRDLRQAKATGEKLYSRLRNKKWWLRWLHIFMQARFRRTYPPCVAALIRNELEIAARKRLAKRVFPEIRQVLTAQNRRVNLVRNSVQSLHDAACQEAHRLDSLSDAFYAPVGRELADAALSEHALADVLAVEGGQDKANRRLFEAFSEKHRGLEVFSQGNPEEIAADLAGQCQDTVTGIVKRLNVLDVFKAAFPTQAQQAELVATAIGQSDARVRTSGESHKDIPRLKYIIGPDDQSVQFMVAIANRISRQGGDWRGHADPAVQGLYFLQYRAGVSITQQIQDSRKFYQLPEDPGELAQLGEDPIVALAPDTDATDCKLDVTIAQALVSGQIHRNGRGCELHQARSSLVLGTVLEEIRATLAASYETRMWIHRQFCLELTRNQEKLLRDIEAIVASHASDGARLAVSLDKTAFDRVRAQAHGLVPYTSRIRLDPNWASGAFEEGRA